MTDKEFRDTKRRIMKIFDSWRLNMGLRHWEVTTEFVREPQEDRVAGRAHVRWEYQLATLEFFCAELLPLSDRNLEEIIVHEMVHILVNEMREFAKDTESAAQMKHEERVTTILTNALIWTRNSERLAKRGK